MAVKHLFSTYKHPYTFAASTFNTKKKMAYKVNSLEEMPNALSYLIESVEVLQSKVNALQHKQGSRSPKVGWI